MTNAFSALSLKRNRSSSTSSSKKESKFNAILNKLTSPFQNSTNTNNSGSNNSSRKKKRRQHSNNNRRSSLSVLFDYFCTEGDTHSTKQDNPFANDALFEQSRYKQQKKQQNRQLDLVLPDQKQKQPNKHCIIPPPLPPLPTNIPSSLSFRNNSATSILIKPTKSTPTIHHRHTNSSPSAFFANGSGISSFSAIEKRKKKSSHVRHYSHVSCISASNITVNSEDLTAKEFADMAGIRILSEQEQNHHDMMMIDQENRLSSSVATSLHNTKKICAYCCGDDEDNNDVMVPSLIVTTTTSKISTSSIMYNAPEEEEEPPQIWDNQFWEKPGQQLEQQESDKVKPYQQQQQKEEEQPSILHELKKYNSVNHQDTFIRKGRFEIHLSVNHHHHNKNSTEWKRKVSNSSIISPTSRLTTTLKHQVTA